jgi:hypothetical protein
VTHEQDVRRHQADHGDRQQQHVVAVHLAEVQNVEEGADAGRVEPVLRLRRDPLRVEVLLRDVAGQGAGDRDHERDRPDHPDAGPPAAPGRHEELAPQVDDHEEEEQLDCPQVDAVDEVPDAGVVPPRRTLQAEHHAGADDDHERGDRQRAEHVDPRGHVGGLAVRQQAIRRHRAHAGFAQAHGPGALAGRAHDRLRRRLPGNGSAIARPKTTIIAAINSTFDTDISKKCQCT